ncbi:conserved hypothetical protein [Perkinsus marinus ATCC 50983]|uniref:Sjoegren syndrome/scleroderma autoantigen n=1 Tax=Perkinsus marinus (strain ATCC 50983 / TXsc) TaxID=423536 RepID=C5K4D0_PERM5|nr:conserved hypothetical protein [Perkinsus marinus ATCC 50983]EER20623.1 conserved hypothetical protein [Perkinsus marinus ATCC 50983]|eukprot:XP_002788827.1 conserved hypothetical protein [Perkinsus marinus ATCC 50983]
MPSDTSAAIGEYLLKGWAMLGESCPQCCIPLMRSPDRVKMMCVGCHTEWPTDEAPKINNGIPQQSTSPVEQREEKLQQSACTDKADSVEVKTEEKSTGWRRTATGELPHLYRIRGKNVCVIECLPESLEKKMNYLSKRLDDAVDIGSIDRIIAAMGSCSEMIDRLSKH